MYLARQRSLADADEYRLVREAEGNRKRLTPEYLEWTFLQALGNNTKIFWGEKLPSMVLDQRLLPTVASLRHGLAGNSKREGGRIANPESVDSSAAISDLSCHRRPGPGQGAAAAARAPGTTAGDEINAESDSLPIDEQLLLI